VIGEKVYLPIRVAAANNFYEYYFLLKQSNAVGDYKKLFNPSTRFLNDYNIE
jgi:hypothetical protein